MCLAGDPKEYVDYKKIGQGSYGIVYKAVHKNTGKEVAIKEFDLTRKYLPLQNLYLSAFREIRVLQEVHHHNMIGVISSHISEEKISLVMRRYSSTYPHEPKYSNDRTAIRCCYEGGTFSR